MTTKKILIYGGIAVAVYFIATKLGGFSANLQIGEVQGRAVTKNPSGVVRGAA